MNNKMRNHYIDVILGGVMLTLILIAMLQTVTMSEEQACYSIVGKEMKHLCEGNKRK